LQRCSKERPSDASSHLPWLSTFDDGLNTGSPVSTFSFNSDAAPLRWFGMLADDAEIENTSFTDNVTTPGGIPTPYPTPQLPFSSPHLTFPAPQVPIVTPRSSVTKGEERELWQSPAVLQDHELPLFKEFVTFYSQRLDLFDPQTHFGSYVPQLAMKNEGLLKAILALSARRASLNPTASSGAPVDRTEAVQYYYETIQYLQRAMKYESFTKSVDILALAIIVSTYEMIDGGSKAWERHLKGVFWIQRSQNNDGESGGLKQAVWWVWIRQDIWAAFRERRRCFSIWKPKRPYHMMDQYDIARRAVYLLAMAVNYSSEEERTQGQRDLQTRIQRADTLMAMLDDWSHHRTIHFTPMPWERTEKNEPVAPIWIHPPIFGKYTCCSIAVALTLNIFPAAAMQMHCFSRILLLVHRPAPGGFLEYVNRERQLMEAVDTIIGIAMTVADDAAMVTSSQCLYGAGLYTTDVAKREQIVNLIAKHHDKTSWPTESLVDELRAEWAKPQAA
jgi:hypothetical protein